MFPAQFTGYVVATCLKALLTFGSAASSMGGGFASAGFGGPGGGPCGCRNSIGGFAGGHDAGPPGGPATHKAGRGGPTGIGTGGGGGSGACAHGSAAGACVVTGGGGGSARSSRRLPRPAAWPLNGRCC